MARLIAPRIEVIRRAIDVMTGQDTPESRAISSFRAASELEVEVILEGGGGEQETIKFSQQTR